MSAVVDFNAQLRALQDARDAKLQIVQRAVDFLNTYRAKQGVFPAKVLPFVVQELRRYGSGNDTAWNLASDGSRDMVAALADDVLALDQREAA